MAAINKITPPDLTEMKVQTRKITMITAYDYPTARVVEEAGVDVVLVGDSVANTVLGYDNTLKVTMDEQLHHVKAVRRGLSTALLVADMPYLSYHIDEIEAVRNAGRFIQEGGAEAIKIEGGMEMVTVIERLLRAKIPVMGHLGLTPQSINIFGGYKVQGKKTNDAKNIIEDAQKLEQSGVFSLVLEGIPWQLSQQISEKLKIPTIGIGAGPFCDGQVLVFHDLVGFSYSHKPRFVREYCNLRQTIKDAVKNYCLDVQKGDFPSLKESYNTKSLSRNKKK